MYKIYTQQPLDTPITSKNFIDYIKKKLNTKYIKLNKELSKIYKVVNHNEYELFNYFKCLFEYYINHPNKMFVIVNNEKEADIIIRKIEGQKIMFERNNKQFIFHIEYPVPIPYLTGFYKIRKYKHIFKNKRKYLLSYIGGTWRGPINNIGDPVREITIKKLNKYSNSIKSTLYEKLFYAPFISTSRLQEAEYGWKDGIFTVKSIEIYFDSVFSWQPNGDTPTRRAFYEALLLGNIPVISYSSYLIYKNLLIGDKKIQNSIIVLEDNYFFDGKYVLKYLLSITQDEINERQKNIIKLSNHLQWNVDLKKNAFSDILQNIIASC